VDYLHMAFELIIGYSALLAVTKFLGKSQITQITAFDFISALILGEFVGNAMYDRNVTAGKILFSIFVWGLLIYITEWLTQKYRRTRPLLEGGPSIIIHNGYIDYQALKKNRMDLDQLKHLLRSKDVFSIQECAFAILETDGTISVVKKPDYDYVTKKDLNIPSPPAEIAVSIISDGEIVEDNLRLIGWSKEQLMEQLKIQGANDVKEVLYAEWKANTPLHVQTYAGNKRAEKKASLSSF